MILDRYYNQLQHHIFYQFKKDSSMSVVNQILSHYMYSQGKSKIVYSNMEIHDAKSKDNNLPYTIKIMKNPDFKLEQYFKKMKAVTSDYVIKIYQFGYDSIENKMVIVQEPCQYGTLKKALHKCKRLDDDDCIFISKMMLNGHIDMLRMGVNWFGDENDIQFTESGLKLSWNNSINFNTNCPFPQLITRIGVRNQVSSILPFPKNKQLSDLINVSKQNASQISLHPLLKKRDKILKKKGKSWIGLKQFKVKGEYIQQLSYLAVSMDHGFVRIKLMEIGYVDEQLLNIHRNKAAFVKIYDHYEESGYFHTISQYANDGTVQNYVKRLKNNNINLKQNQIQFFFFSVIQPLKFIHQSHVRSLNMLHIRNIFIQNGIPKIGQPIPLTSGLKQTLKDRAQVPDFYHSNFKQSPESKDPRYDTYSLGVLLYKLMYTQYPIFPQKLVHIPSAPSYKKNLKFALQLFLNQGGKLEQLEKQLQISDDVKLQIKNNEKILQQVTSKNKQLKINVEQEQKNVEDSQLEFQEDRKDKDVVQLNFLQRAWRWMTKRGRDTKGKYTSIYKSEYDGYRICVTILIVLLFYFFAFFLFFVDGAVNLITYTRLFTPYAVNILGQNHKIITPSFYNFSLEYQKVQNNSVLILNQTMKCVVDNKLSVYTFVNPTSPHWFLYISLGIGAMIAFLILKGYQLYTYSTARAGFHHYDTTISGSNQSRFAISTFIYFHLWQAMTLYCFYYLFNVVFNEQHLPCFGNINWISLTSALFSDRLTFAVNYLIILCIGFFFFVMSFAQLRNYQRIRYSMLVNPLLIYTPFYVALFIMMRIGAFTPFIPSYISNSAGIIGSSYMNIIGYFPQILVVVELMLCFLIDFIFYSCMDEKIKSFIVEQSHSEQLKLDQ